MSIDFSCQNKMGLETYCFKYLYVISLTAQAEYHSNGVVTIN